MKGDFIAMIQISDVSIISIDKGDDSWAIEGEVLFEEDLSTAFEVTYLSDEDELEDLSMEINPGEFDKGQLKDMIIKAALDFED